MEIFQDLNKAGLENRNIPVSDITFSDALPTVNFDTENGFLTFTGKCYPSNPDKFFAPIIREVQEYLQLLKKEQSLMLNIRLDYMNSSSIKYFVKLIALIHEIIPEGLFVVNWYYVYHDSEMLELGEILGNRAGYPINLIEMS